MDAQTSSNARPVLALVKIAATPYWVHLHRRIDREVPEVELHCLYAFGVGDQPWVLSEPDVRPVVFATPGDVDIDRALYTLPRDWRKAGRMIRWLKEHDAAAVVVSGYHNMLSPRVAHWCRRRGIPCFVTGDSNIHADRAVGWKRRVKSAVIRWMIRQCRGMLPFGTAGKKFFLKYGADPSSIFFFPGEPDYQLLESITDEQVRAVSATYVLRAERRRLVFCGRLIQVKRVDLLIDAFAAIADERPEWDVVIIGDGPLKADLQARVPERLRSRFLWTGFIADQRTLGAMYRACDVLALPSDHEPWALVVNEALAAGLAVVASDVVGAADDLVRAGVNGCTFARGDAGSLTRALREVTEPGRIDGFRGASKGVLGEWRRVGDPVRGLRAALTHAGVL